MSPRDDRAIDYRAIDYRAIRERISIRQVLALVLDLWPQLSGLSLKPATVDLCHRLGIEPIAQLGCAAARARDNVLDVEGSALQRLMQLAILASPRGTLVDLAFDLVRQRHANLRPNKRSSAPDIKAAWLSGAMNRLIH